MEFDDDFAVSRENKSNAKPEGPCLEDVLKVKKFYSMYFICNCIKTRKENRKKSMEEYYNLFGNEIRENVLMQNRSFNGLSLMVDAARKIFKGFPKDEAKLEKAVEETNIDYIK